MSESEETIDSDNYETDTSYMETDANSEAKGKYKSKLKKEK